MELEVIILSKLGPSPKTKYCVSPSLVLPRFYVDTLNHLCVPDIKAEMKLKGTKKNNRRDGRQGGGVAAGECACVQGRPASGGHRSTLESVPQKLSIFCPSLIGLELVK